MKKLLLCLILILSVSVIQSQDIKSFNGEFAGEIGLGKASYSYFIDSGGNEIRHGNYKFVETHSSSDRGSYTATLTGTFRNGLKHGAWTYTRALNDAQSSGGIYVTSATNVKMNYNNGIPDGSWSYSQNGKYRERLYGLSGWRWGNYQSQKPVDIRLNWRNGTLVGSLTYHTPYVNTVGQLNSDGKWIGKWVLDGHEYTVEDGIVMTGIKNADGRYEDQELVNLRKQYISLSDKEKKEFSLKHRLKVDTLRGINYYNINDGYFNKRVFNCNEPHGKYEKTDQLNYGHYVVIDRARIIPLKDLLSGINLNFQTPELLEQILYNHTINLVDEDIVAFQKLIEDFRLKKKHEAEEKKHKESYDKLYARLSELTEIDREHCLRTASPTQYGWGYVERLREIDGFINNLTHNIDWRAKYFSNNNYQISDFSSYGYNPDYGKKEVLKTGNNTVEPIVSIKESYERLSEYMRYVESRQENIELVGKLYSCFPEEIRNNVYKVEYEYRINPKQSVVESLLGVSFSSRDKLYIPYFKTLKYLSLNINKKGSFEEVHETVSDINALCLFMVDNAREKTKDIEKELSSTDNVENWAEIFKRYVRR